MQSGTRDWRAMRPHLDLVIMLMLMMMMEESEANMGAIRLVRFEKKPDSIYRAVRIWAFGVQK